MTTVKWFDSRLRCSFESLGKDDLSPDNVVVFFFSFHQSPERLKLQRWSERVEGATAKLGATFRDYNPDNGNWVFTVSEVYAER